MCVCFGVLVVLNSTDSISVTNEYKLALRLYCWISFDTVFSCMYYLVHIFLLSPFHTLSTISNWSPSIFYVSFVCLFDLILYVPSTIFQFIRDGSSWVEPVLS